MLICAFSTGKPYWKYAAHLARDLDDYGKELLLLTDNPDYFRRQRNVTCLPMPSFKRFHHNLKVHVYRAGIARAEQMLYIDADTVLREGLDRGHLDALLAREFPPGLHTHETHPRANYTYPLYEDMANALGLRYDLDNITYQERICVLRRCGHEKAFLDLWEKFGEDLVARGSFGGGDGTVMAICAQASGVPCWGSTHFQGHSYSQDLVPMRHKYPLGMDLRPLRKLRARMKGLWPR